MLVKYHHLSSFLKALFKAEDEQDVRAASTAKAEQVAEMAEFNENVPLKADVITCFFIFTEFVSFDIAVI